jgi:hypothetical protein
MSMTLTLGESPSNVELLALGNRVRAPLGAL